MTRGWWGWMGHEARRAATSRPESVEMDPNATDGIPSPNGTFQRKLSAPTGTTTWIVLTPAGGKSAWDSEAEAMERASESVGAVVYPCVIEERETA